MARSVARSRGYVCVPKFTVKPSVSGTAQSGQTLTGASGTVKDGAVTARQWMRGGVAIGGATNATYVLQPDDVGGIITFRVTASGTLNAANKVIATSPPTAAVIAA